VSLLPWLLRGVLLLPTTWRNCTNELSICYEFHLEAKNQSDAEASCHRRNGQLATILDRERQLYVQNLIGTSSAEYWIGGTLHTMPLWGWVSGTYYSGTVNLYTTAVLRMGARSRCKGVHVHPWILTYFFATLCYCSNQNQIINAGNVGIKSHNTEV